MKNIYKTRKATLPLILLFITGSFLPDCSLHAQQLVDSLKWSTMSGIPVLATSQNNLYIGNASYIGKGIGNSAFFLNGSSQPAEGMPTFSDDYSNCGSRRVWAAVKDGKGGWYVGGDFAAANGEKTGPLVHILPDKSIEQPFVDGLTFSPYKTETVSVLKKDGNFLYVGGTFLATDNSGNTYKSLFRVNLSTKTVDPTFNPISLKNKYIEPRIKQIEVSADKIFISGTSLTDDDNVSFLVLDIRTGNRIAAPPADIATIKLLGNDTLLFSSYSPGYPAQKLAILDTVSDTSLIKNRSIVLRYPFLASIADGKGGWYVAGDEGVFHYDREFKKDDAFSQNHLTNGYYFLTKQLLLSGNQLFVVYDGQIDIHGKNISQVFKLDARTGAIDTSFSLQPDGKVYTIAAKGDTLFVSGTFNNIAGNAQPRLAAVSCSTGKFIDWHPVVNICSRSYDGIGIMLIHKNLLYAGGKFKIPGTPDMASVARFDLNTGKADTSFQFNALLKNCGNTNITGMALYHNKLFLAGYFSLDLSNEQIKNLVYINLDDKTIHPVSRSYTTSIPSWDSRSPKLTEYNGKIYCQGVSVTDTASLLSRKYFFAFDANSGKLAQWNPNPNDQVFSFSVSKGRFLISGYFTVLKTLFINNEISKSLAALNTHTFQYIPIHNHGKILTGTVNSFSYNDKYIFAGCNSMTYGDSTINGILRLNRKDLSFSSFHPHLMTGANPSTIYKIALGTNGLFILGSFNTETGIQKTVRLVDPETGEVKKWHPALSDSPTKIMLVSSNNVILSTYYGSLWPAYKREKLGKIDLSTDQLSQWTLDVRGNGWVQKMTMSGDTIFVLFDDPVILNHQDTGVFFPIDNISGHVIPGFKSPTISQTLYPGMRSFARQGSHIFIIGNFDKVNSEPHNHVVKINLKTGIHEQWSPPITSTSGFSAIVTYKDTVYLGGQQIQVKDDQNYYSLISVDASTGKIIRKYQGAYSNKSIGAMAVNKSGDIVVLKGEDYYGFQKVLLLPAQNRDSLIEVNKIEETGNHFTAVKPAGNLFLFALNNIKEKGKVTSKPGFITYNPQLDTVFNVFGIPVINRGNKGIRSFAFTDKILAIGGDFCGVYGNPKIKNLAFLTMPDLHLKPGITSWAPNKANNLNPFAVRIYGTGFGSSTSVSLSNGKKTIATDSLIVQSNKMIAWFNGTHFPVGNWDLIVKINDTLSKSYPQAFHITQGSHADVWAKWTGPKVVLVHKPETYYITVGNSGNTGAYGVYLYIATGLNQTVEYPNYIKRPHVQYKNFTIDMDTVTPYSVVDYFMDQPFHGKVYSLFIPYIPAGFESGFSIHIRSDVHGETPEMVMAVSPPLYESFDEMNQNLKSTEGMFWSFIHCVYDIGGVLADLAPGVGCAKSIFDNFIVAGYNKYKAGQVWEVSDITKSAGLVGLDCAGGRDVKLAYEISAKLVQVGTGLQSISQSCDDFFKHLTGNHAHAQTKVSVDPNGKFGPIGMNASQYVPTAHPFQYLITFENDSAATAPAQRVIITDTLDKNVFDLTSFRPVGFGFGDTTYLYKESDGDTVYIDLRPAKNTIVRVFYHLDQNSGRLIWTFQALNPDTYEYVTNVNDGFLPPNKKAPEGDGNILYSIMPLSGLTDGTEIKNTAHIVFDWNTDIPTKAWVNQTDDTPPESAVSSLPNKEVNKDFTVSWGGSDDGSGIYAYTVFVSENDSTYYPWIVDTHDTSAVFSGTAGSTYKFYSIATDSAGNMETAPGIYDATTRVSGTGIDKFGEGNKMQFRLYPNPAKDQVNVQYYLPESSSIRIDVLNVCGHLIMEPVKTSGSHGNSKIQVDISKLPAGYYFVRILSKYGVQIRKVVVQ
jgi:hypothetical protein